jgi:hypothetical protein
MNELTIRLLWLMGQVTLLSLVAGVFCAVSARRRPGAGAGIAFAGLIGLILLTVLATIPLPVWWSWKGLVNGDHEAAAGRAVLSTQNPVLSTRPSGEVGKGPGDEWH